MKLLKNLLKPRDNVDRPSLLGLVGKLLGISTNQVLICIGIIIFLLAIPVFAS